MDSNSLATLSEAHPETMDFLSRAWCNFAVQALHPRDLHRNHSIVLKESTLINNSPTGAFEKETTPNFHLSQKLDGSAKMDWKSNDLKSWIWMQQAMHPELNYNSCFHKKWMPWNKMMSFKNVSIKKWIKEIQQRRKEKGRLQRAQVHAAVSVAGVAAALAAVAAQNSSGHEYKEESGAAVKDSAVASAAALVAAQCAQVAEAMGAKREQLSAVIGSAMTGTSASDILTLTAAATTSLRGAATLKARTGGRCNNKSRINGGTPVLPIDQNNNNNYDEDDDEEFNGGHHLSDDFENCRSLLAKGALLNLQASDGKYMMRYVSVILNDEAKVILKIKKINLMKAFASMKESVVIDLHAELYKGEDSETEEINSTCYLIALTTNHGIIKLDMKDDHQSYKMWTTTINRMLMLSTSFTRYELQFYEN